MCVYKIHLEAVLTRDKARGMDQLMSSYISLELIYFLICKMMQIGKTW